LSVFSLFFLFCPSFRRLSTLFQVEFKAGLLNINGTFLPFGSLMLYSPFLHLFLFTFPGTTVTADTRRGKVQLIQDPNDGFLHLQWVQRPSGTLSPQVPF
jgi:hypothetical protein